MHISRKHFQNACLIFEIGFSKFLSCMKPTLVQGLNERESDCYLASTSARFKETVALYK